MAVFKRLSCAAAAALIILFWPPTSRMALPVLHYEPPYNFGVVEKGRIYRSAEPDPEFFRRVLIEHRIKTVLVLNKSRDSKKDKIAQELGASMIHMPMHIRNIGYARASWAADLVADPAHQPILVYCSEGIERTGFVIALYRMKAEGWKVGRIFTEMLEYNFRPAKNPKMVYYLLRKKRETAARTGKPLSLQADDEKSWNDCKRRRDDSSFFRPETCWKTGD